MFKATEAVAITGMGIVTPAGSGMSAARTMWFEGQDYFGRISRFPASGGKINWGYQIRRPDISIIPDRKAEKVLNEKDLSAIVTMLEAIQSSGLTTEDRNPERVSIYCAAGNTQLGDLSPYFSPVKECVDPIAGIFDSRVFGKKLLELVNPLVVMRTLLNNSLCFGSKFLDARGPNSNYFDFENSGMRCLYEAHNSLLENRSDVAIVSGVAPVLEPFALGELIEDGFCLPTAEDDPPRGVPYDRNSQGYTPGEGAATFVLERLDDARSRKAQIHAVIESIVIGCEAEFPFACRESNSSLRDCWRAALERASVGIRDVGVCVGSAAGHPDLDEVELATMRTFQNESATKIPLMSIKGSLGETFEVSNLLSVAAAIDMFALNKVLPSMHFRHGRETAESLAVSGQTQPLLTKRALISSRGMFGSTGAMILREPPPDHRSV